MTAKLKRHDTFAAAYLVWTYVRKKNNLINDWHQNMLLPATQAYVTIKRSTTKRMVLEGLYSPCDIADDMSPAHMVARDFLRSMRQIAETYETPTMGDLAGASVDPSDKLFIAMVMDLKERGHASPEMIDRVLHGYQQLTPYRRGEVTDAFIRATYLKPKGGVFEPSESIWKGFISWAQTTYRDFSIENT